MVGLLGITITLPSLLIGAPLGRSLFCKVTVLELLVSINTTGGRRRATLQYTVCEGYSEASHSMAWHGMAWLRITTGPNQELLRKALPRGPNHTSSLHGHPGRHSSLASLTTVASAAKKDPEHSTSFWPVARCQKEIPTFTAFIEKLQRPVGRHVCLDSIDPKGWTAAAPMPMVAYRSTVQIGHSVGWLSTQATAASLDNYE
ncbi:uncharacterized protein PAC_14844 [Phialocephala subalpina]|uniref:Uncharacterized protein n=1 Tax=Phialocephala subalpina TaxID=576137 RepID=A0A1L7XIU0_9HELO|nr:uncharacterized protein PAC_14844 [Phialocephala subalpina]